MENKETKASIYLDEIGVPYVWMQEDGNDIIVVDVETITPDQREYLLSIDC